MKTNLESNSDRHLVTEQPGTVILVAGIALSVFFGVTIKSLLSPARVTARIEKAATHIHKDVQVKFSAAQVSLADGILPRIAVVISDVRMESEQKCWGAPILEVDELRLPVSLTSLLRGRSPLRRIDANAMVINFREDIEKCDEEVEENRFSGGGLVSLSPVEIREKYQNDIRMVRIQKLKIASRKYPALSSEFMSLQAQVKSFEPKVIELRAKTHLLKEQRVGDYMSHANIFLEYKESPEKTLQSHIFGNWREGHYSIISNYSMDDDFLTMESDLKHIPLSQIIDLMKRYNLTKADLSSRQIWFSSKARLAGPMQELRRTPLEIRDVRLEGDIGEIYSERIQFQSLEPLRYSPIFFEVKKLDVSKALAFVKKTPKATFLGNLGIFHGSAEIRSEDQVKAQGELSGLEFLFANKGQSETQVIDRVSLDMALKKDEATLVINRMEPRGGVFVGDLTLRHDFSSEKMNLKIHVDELSLGSNVQNLMTNGGEIGPLNLDAEANLVKGFLTTLKGELRATSMTVEGVSLQKTRVSAMRTDSGVVLDTKIAELKVSETSPATSVLQQVTRPEWWQAGVFSLDAVHGKFEIGDQGSFKWKNFVSQVDKNEKFMTSGAWDANAQLSGSIGIAEGKKTQKWSIKGDRENPRFEKEKPDQ